VGHGLSLRHKVEEAVLSLPADNPTMVVRRLLRVCEMLRRQVGGSLSESGCGSGSKSGCGCARCCAARCVGR
jgi:hypothetical protein